MKSIGFGAWRIQLYWPSVWLGGYGSWGVKADTAFMLRCGDGWRAFGWQFFGFGFGVSYDFDSLKPPQKEAR